MIEPPAVRAGTRALRPIGVYAPTVGASWDMKECSFASLDHDVKRHVTDDLNHRVQKFTSTGVYLTQWGSPGGGDGQFTSPVGPAVDASGGVYVTDACDRVQKFTESGSFLAYVVDTGNNRIQNFGDLATAARSSTWGRVKSVHR